MSDEYADVDEIKQVLADTPMSDAQDPLLVALAERASRLVDAHTRRSPATFAVQTDGTRYFDGSGGINLLIGELAAAPTSVAVAEAGDLTDYTAWAATDYLTWPYNSPEDGTPILRLDIDQLNGTKATWYRYRKAVKIVGRWGFSTEVPPEIKQLVITQVMRWFNRGRQMFQDVGAIAELGQLTYVQQLDPDIAAILDIPKFSGVHLLI